MLRFREFLKEEVQTDYPWTTTYVNFDRSKSNLANSRLNVGDNIDQQISDPFFEGFDIIEFRYSNDNKFEIKTEIKKDGIVDTHEHFMEYKSQISIAVRKMTEVNYIRLPFPETSHVFCIGLPKLFVGNKLFDIDCSKVPSLSGADRIINCEKLQLNFAQNIKGHILSLMKMSNLKKVNTPMCKWGEIIQQHLDGDRDLLDCQEDLISNGFKNYAKL